MTNLDKHIEFLNAFKSGKRLQVKDLDDNTWQDVRRYEELLRTGVGCIRIKPEPKLRPYTFDEIGRELKKHGGYVTMDGKSIKSIILINGDYVKFGCGGCASLIGLFNQFVWLDDGSPCGVMEE